MNPSSDAVTNMTGVLAAESFSTRKCTEVTSCLWAPCILFFLNEERLANSEAGASFSAVLTSSSSDSSAFSTSDYYSFCFTSSIILVCLESVAATR